MKYLIKNNKKKLQIGLSIVLVIAIVIALMYTFVLPKNKNTSTPNDAAVSTPTEVKEPEIKKEVYYGFLFLGSDKGAENTNGGNHTDSITYVAYSPEKNQVFTMPIYRDVLLSLTCGGELNINHVYRDKGAECLMKSVEQMLTMPVDYYVYTTADGFVSMTDSIGGVDVMSQETFCSPFSNDGKTYCVEAGKSYTMSGNMLLAYARDRNHGSGVPRANRHQAILAALSKKCVDQFTACATGATKEMIKGNVAHNLPIASILDLQKTILLPKNELKVTRLDAIKGENYADSSGEWHMKVDSADIQAKKTTIQATLGERKKES